MTFKKILIAIDSEPIAAHAADVGAELARAVGAEMAFVHVIDPEVAYAADTGLQPDVLVASAREAARKLIADFRRTLPEQTAAREFIQIGKPLAEVVAAARDWPAELIVIGSHGRGGVERALLGSVAEGVMRHAPARSWWCGRRARRRAAEVESGPVSRGSVETAAQG